MADVPISVLEFVNRVRALQGLPACEALALRGTEPERDRCIVSSVLGVRIDLSAHRPPGAVAHAFARRIELRR